MSDLNLAIKLTTSGGKIVVKDLQQIEAATGKVNHSLGATGKSGSVAGQGLTKASTGANALTSSLKSTIAQAVGIIGLSVAIKSLTTKIIEVGNLTQGWNAAMQAITGSQDAANKALQHSRGLAKRLGLDIKSTTDSYVQFTAATQGTALQGEKTNQVFDAISMSMRVLNRSSDDTSGALKALEQMVSKGTVQAEELRGQLGERLPGAFNLAAKAMGKTTKELGKMLENGQVMAADLLPKLAKVLTEKYGKGLAIALDSPAQAFRNLSTATFEFNEKLSNSFFDEFASGAQLLADSLTGIGDYLPEITSLLAGLSVVVGARLLVAFSTLTYKGIYNYIKGNIAASISTNALGQVIGRTTVKMNLMAVAGRAAKGALALLGGPAGIAIIAASAFYSFAKSTFAADNGMKDLTRSIDKALGKFNEIEKKALNKDIEERLALIKKLQAEIAKIYNSAKTINGKVNLGLSDQGEIADATKAMQTLGGEVQQLKGKLKALTKTKNTDTDATSEQMASITGLSKELQQLFDRLDPALASTTKFNQEVVRLTKSYNDGKLSLSDYNHYMQLLGAERAKQLTGKTKELTTNQKLIAALESDIKLSKMSATKKAIEINLSKLSADATQKEKDRVTELTNEKLAALAVEQQKQDDSAYYDNIINGANDIGEAWNSAGNVIIDTFGSIGQQLEKLAAQQESYAKKQKRIAKDKITYADDPKKLAEIAQAEKALAKQKSDHALAEIGSYRAISDSAAQMFGENTKGRQAMQAASNVFTAIELANSALRIGSYAIEAVTAAFAAPWPIGFASGAAMIAIMAGLGVAVSGGGSAPMSSADRQANQGTGTVLGSDDKSQSLLNAYSRIESLELDQYAELRQMNGTLRDLNNNITHLAVSLVRGYGKFDGSSYGGELGSKSTTTKFEELLIGGVFGQVAKALDPTGIIGKIFSSFSSKKKSLIDSGISIVAQTLGQVINSGVLQAKAFFDIKTKKKSFWGLSSSTKYNTEYQSIDAQLQREFALIFTNIGDSINAAVDVLGLDVTRNLANFVIDLPNISFKDMSGEQIQKELEAMFSQQADMMATYLVPSIGDFQQAGEGLYETLIRVAQEQVVFNQVLELTAQSLNSLDAYAQIEVAQSIIEFAGSIEALQSAANTYLNEFFSDAEQFDFLSTQLNSQFSELNINLPKTRDGFKNLLGSLDLTVESDQRLYAALMLLIPQLDSYYDALEQQRKKAEEAAKAERQLADDRRAFTVDLKQQLASFDMSSLELAVRDVNNWRDNAIASAKDFVGMDFSLIEKIAGKKREKIVEDTLKQIISTSENKMTQLVSNFDNNVNAITNTLEQLTSAIKSTSLSIGEAILTIQKTLPSFDGVAFFGGKASSLRGQLGSGSASSQLNVIEQLKAAIVERYNAELTAITRVQTLGDERYQTELDSYQTQLDAVNSLRDAAISLKKAASDLLVGDLSPLTMSQQLSEAQAQFNRLVAKAKGGDVNAYNDLQSSGSNYLKVAQQYDPANYQGIFDSVYGTFNNLGNKTFSDPTAPLPNPATTAYQQQSEQLAQRTISELQNLQALTQTLTVTATQEYNNAFAELQNQFTSDSSAIITTMQNSIGELRDLLPVETDKMLEKMQQQIDAIFDMRNAVVSSVDALEFDIPDPAPINIEIPPMELPPWFKKLPIEITYPPVPPIYDPKTGGIFNEDPKPEPKQIEQLEKINANLAAQGKILQKTQQANELQAKRLDKLDKSFNSLSNKLNDVNNELLDKIDKGAA